MKFTDVKPESDFEVIAGNARSQAAIMVLTPDTSTGGPDNKHEESDQWLYVNLETVWQLSQIKSLP